MDPLGNPEGEGGEEKTSHHICKVVVTQVDGGDPDSDAGEEHEPESIPAMLVIKHQDEEGNAAVKAGKDIDSAAAEGDHAVIESGHGPADQLLGEDLRHGQMRATGGHHGVT